MILNTFASITENIDTDTTTKLYTKMSNSGATNTDFKVGDWVEVCRYNDAYQTYEKVHNLIGKVIALYRVDVAVISWKTLDSGWNEAYYLATREDTKPVVPIGANYKSIWCVGFSYLRLAKHSNIKRYYELTRQDS